MRNEDGDRIILTSASRNPNTKGRLQIDITGDYVTSTITLKSAKVSETRRAAFSARSMRCGGAGGYIGLQNLPTRVPGSRLSGLYLLAGDSNSVRGRDEHEEHRDEGDDLGGNDGLHCYLVRARRMKERGRGWERE